MLYLIIAIPLAFFALAFGATWPEILIAFAIALAVGLGSKVAHECIEHYVQRKAEPRTAHYSMTLFMIGLGGALVSAYLLYDSHRVVSFAAVCACFFAGDMLGHLLFGARTATAGCQDASVDSNHASS